MSMPRFSERIGAVKVEIQLDSMDQRLRNSLWNLVRGVLPPERDEQRLSAAVSWIAAEVLKQPVDMIPGRYSVPGPRDWLFQQCMKATWATMYEVTEFVATNARVLSVGQVTPENIRRAANQILEEEHAAYRFVGGELTPITNPLEIAEVEAALVAGGLSFTGAHAHIDQALQLFGKRPVPDYRNAIKEAISAVESTAKVLSGEDKATLAGALKIIGEAKRIHPAMVEGFLKLYGYTSDEKGIRHALLEESANVAEEDVRFMIVACSAFVNLLIVKANGVGLAK